MKYVVLCDGNHDYDIFVTKNKNSTLYEMRYSEGEQWNKSFEGQVIMSAIDDGNGISFTNKFDKRFEYHSILELKIFLDFIHSHEKSPVIEIYQKVNQ